MTEKIIDQHYFEAFCKRVHNPDTPTWIKLNRKSESRCGSIGLLVPRGYEGVPRSDWAPIGEPGPGRNRYSNGHWDRWTYDSNFVFLFEGLDYKHIDMGNFHTIVHKSWRTREFPIHLIGYTGPAVRVNVKPPEVDKTPKEVHDKFGVAAKVGDFMVFARYKGIEFGTITRITHTGLIHFRTTLGGTESRLDGDNREFAIMDKDFREQMMLRKLTQ